MRILIVSGLPWNNGNSFGSTFSSFLEGIPSWEYANIYCGYGEPENNVSCRSFQITEVMLLKNMFSPSKHTPYCIKNDKAQVRNEDSGHRETSNEIAFVDRLRKYNGRLMFWGRCLIWRMGRWRTPALDKFIDDFQPDIIFSPLYTYPYLSRISLYAQKRTGKKLVLFIGDDIYSLHQFSLSPFFWVERLFGRRNIRKIVNRCEYLYVISDIQKKEYELSLHKECRILTKGADFSGRAPLKNHYNDPLRLVYTGAIYGGRWRELYRLGKALRRVNGRENKAQLLIYTQSKLSSRIIEKLTENDCVCLMGEISGSQVPKVQKEADILVHVESQRLSEKLTVRHSFSTKLVDYFKSGRCILAVGPRGIASIDYLVANKCALVASTEEEIVGLLNRVYDDKTLLDKVAQRAWVCGARNHQIEVIHDRIKEDFRRLLVEYSK